MQMVRDILMYMDRTYVSSKKKMPVYEMGLVVFRDTVARHEKVKGRLQSLLLQVRFDPVTLALAWRRGRSPPFASFCTSIPDPSARGRLQSLVLRVPL